MMTIHQKWLPRRSTQTLEEIRQDLWDSLQHALRLEHATIPAYLYALYSLKPGRNARIAALFESVVKEEMLHMLLVCNLINAVGGRPELASPSFIPIYPTRAPGAVAGRLRIGLEPFSPELVNNVFMTIESPDRPVRLRRGRYAIPAKHKTIGDLYRAVIRRLRAGGSDIFVTSDSRQVVHDGMDGLIPITNLETALNAIETIVEQGEGNLKEPTDDDGKYGHYYRFAEIYHGREIVVRRGVRRSAPAFRRYAYDGPEIPFDPEGVWSVPSNPHASVYKIGTRARRSCDTFNYTYTSMLRALHDVVNGEQRRLRDAVGQMFSLKAQAMEMMSEKWTEELNIGPTFEYQPINPA